MHSLSLAKLAIEAHGGLDRWRRFKTVSARLHNGGALWPLKHQQGRSCRSPRPRRLAQTVGVSLAVHRA
jgi:hypothetical protein